jgi:hypothetical protein
VIGEWVKFKGTYGQVTEYRDGFAIIKAEDGGTYRVRETVLKDAMQAQEWAAQDYVEDPDDGDCEKPMGTPFTDHRRTVAKTEQPKPRTTAPQHGDSWLGDDGKRREINKARGRMFASVVLSDDMITDVMMRRSE